MEAKREETRDRRFATLLACSREGVPVGPPQPPPPPSLPTISTTDILTP